MKCGECPVATTNPKDKMDCYFCPFDKVDAFHSLHDCSHLSELVERMAELLKEREEFGEELNNAVELIRKKDEKVKELLKEQPQWIPISGEKPKCKGDYIVTRWVSDGCTKKMLSDIAYFNGTDTWYDDCYTVYDPDRIVAWMPLPEPYRTDT